MTMLLGIWHFLTQNFLHPRSEKAVYFKSCIFFEEMQMFEIVPFLILKQNFGLY